MKRYFILILFISNFSLAFSQNDVETDTSFYTPMFDRDTNARVHMGVKVGSLIQGVMYKANQDPQYKDSISTWRSDNHVGFLFGLVVDTRLSPHWNLKSGFDIVVSKISLYTEEDSLSSIRSSNYSTIQIPAWFTYAPRIKANRFHFGGGIIWSADISKREVKFNRLVQLNTTNLILGLGMGYRVQLPSKVALNIDMQLRYGILNMVSKDDNFYNNAMDSINLWEFVLFVSLD